MGAGELYGREAEAEAIAELLAGARAGTSSSLVLRGEPGIGKTALLDHVAAAAGDMRLVRGSGVEFEAELPFSGLQLLLRPALGSLAAIPGPQRAALEAAFGLGPAAGSEPMLTGLAVLSLLAEHAGERGLLCLVDDAHWLDHASRDALLFAARRLHAEGVVIVFAARDGEGSFPAPGLAELRLSGLAPEAAAALLDRHPLAPAVRYRLLAEARGNPLALLELPVALAAEGGSAFAPGALPLTSRLQLAFHGQVSRMPESCQSLLLVAAADQTGELAVILRAAAELGAAVEDLSAAEQAGLVLRGDADGTTIRFRHPLIRAAVYQRAPIGQRLAVHRALAAALGSPEHADRRAWHLAAAATGPDEEAAAALERTAARARERGGHEAAAAAYERAARLSVEPAARAHREALVAEAALEAGDLERARSFGGRAARQLEKDPAANARIAHVRALADFWQGSYPAAHRLLLDGAELIRDTDPGQAAVLLIQAVHTAWYLGERPLAATLDRLAALPLDEAHPLAPVGPYLVHLDRGRSERPPPLADTLAAVRRRGRAPDQALMILCGAALALGQDADAYELATALAAEHRARGGAGRLPTVLFFVAEGEVFTGRHLDALATATEALALARDTGQQQWASQFSSVLAYLDAAKGDEAACRRTAEEGLAEATAGAISPGAPWAHWSLGLLDLGLGRAEAALARFERLTREPMRHHICATRSTPDLVESAVRVGAPERAAEPLARFEGWAGAVRQPWADALVLRCRGLLAADDQAESFYTAALELHDHDRRPLEFARTALLYGEWLRRARRKAEARGPLHDALEVFDRLGMRPWAERVRGELTATGAQERGPRPAEGVAAALTPQELQIARLAAQGLSNRDIAAQLFLSHRTVGYHLYKAYPKLGVASRSELKDFAGRLGL
ncbi:putative transcriptional regulator [[Actinomadura] parvosata subsp. kistnae]|uniref:Helix-turn-helix transcriptional regulator n=1 Tax=[Actinomadura] parvosata subsp. kistnae TaxID=1909395 RepID=A0A1U9ZY16_9ACTN|nr:LuxR family transcriptional regulator [Nonomuraea sp. ATCC 55076]AQZ62845.1 helix-turn-helix transcriptional regulator [Nonomuraea sp. ATCC 55076]SPL98387.1 putative transcriptional regulator [Actinomadura parvosata subsp. kistnae]